MAEPQFDDEFDGPTEVDATFRTQRRVAVGYFTVFLLATLSVPGLTLVLDWWWQGRVIGGMSPNFLMAAAGLYLLFFMLAVAAATLANAVEDRMLGTPADRTGRDTELAEEIDARARQRPRRFRRQAPQRPEP